jgi:hypothetical protein
MVSLGVERPLWVATGSSALHENCYVPPNGLRYPSQIPRSAAGGRNEITFCQFSFPVLNIAIMPDPERQTTLVCNSEIFQSLSSWMKFPSKTLCARK